MRNRRGRVLDSTKVRRATRKLVREDRNIDRLNQHRQAPKGFSVCVTLAHNRRFFIRVRDFDHAERVIGNSRLWRSDVSRVRSIGMRLDGAKH